ncbi:MAG: hypothetical protein M5R40_05320 [Anaerolineae bacterium]|nr:hypothetical protein [Anaerolineae bacterium]
MAPSIDRIKTLMDEVRAIEASAPNQARKRLWQARPHAEFEPAFIRTLPYARARGGKIPFVVEPALGMWVHILGFDRRAYYTDPVTYLTVELEKKVYHARLFRDDTYIDKSFRILIATALEASLVGVPYAFTAEGHPLPDYLHPPVKAPSDLARLDLPDFHRTGLMPTIIRLYEEMRRLLDDDFLVKFPDWIMGPFGVATELRGFDGLLIDMVQRPGLRRAALCVCRRSAPALAGGMRRLPGRQAHARPAGQRRREYTHALARLYREMVLPWEQKLCATYGGIFYWHSCGDTSALIPDIARIPTLDLFHVGPKTDIARAAQVFGPRAIPLEICPDPIEKVQQATPDQQRDHLAAVRDQIPADVSCCIKVDSLEVLRSPEAELATIQQWIATARELLG